MRPIHKRADSLFLRCVAALLFLAACAWGGAWLSARLRPRALEAFAEEEAALPRITGLCLRREEALRLPAAAELLVSDGERVAKGGALARLSDGGLVTARESAVYFADCDGLESLSAERLTELSPAALRRLRESATPEKENIRGRLVYDTVWYCAALMAEAEAPKAPCACRLRVTGFRDWLPARLVAVGGTENGERALLFRLNRGGDYLRLREIEAEVWFPQ